jgi:hypothetical protein
MAEMIDTKEYLLHDIYTDLKVKCVESTKNYFSKMNLT